MSNIELMLVQCTICTLIDCTFVGRHARPFGMCWDESFIFAQCWHFSVFNSIQSNGATGSRALSSQKDFSEYTHIIVGAGMLCLFFYCICIRFLLQLSLLKVLQVVYLLVDWLKILQTMCYWLKQDLKIRYWTVLDYSGKYTCLQH